MISFPFDKRCRLGSVGSGCLSCGVSRGRHKATLAAVAGWLETVRASHAGLYCQPAHPINQALNEAGQLIEKGQVADFVRAVRRAIEAYYVDEHNEYPLLSVRALQRTGGCRLFYSPAFYLVSKVLYDPRSVYLKVDLWPREKEFRCRISWSALRDKSGQSFPSFEQLVRDRPLLWSDHRWRLQL